MRIPIIRMRRRNHIKLFRRNRRKVSPIRYFPSDFRLGDPLLPASLIREFDFKKNRMELVALHATGFGRPSQAAWTEIFADGQPLRIARWPNDSTIMIGKIQESGMAKEGKELLSLYSDIRKSALRVGNR